MSLVWEDPGRIRSRSAKFVDDRTLQQNLNRAAEHERAARRGLESELPWEKMREQARAYRADSIEHLPELLDRLERSVNSAGGLVHRAATGDEAAERVTDICKKHGASMAVKGKSMLSEEIDLNSVLKSRGVTPVETDLGEYIVQELGDHPSHILAPAVHLNAAQVAKLFSRLGSREIPADDTDGLVNFARRRLRDLFLEAEVGISGVNFAVAETGTLIIVESEGNIRMCTTQTRVHIALMGVERVLRDWEAAAHLTQMLSMAAHGTRMAANVSLITGPARSGERGPDELHLVLVDNGRSSIRGGPYQEVLHCIRCAACLAVCPVYRQVGGHTYGSTYSGPIGAVLTPLLSEGSEESGRLAELSSLCGACRDVCPVDIPLDDFLVRLRMDSRRLEPRKAERTLFKAWARLWSRPALYRATASVAGKALFPLWGAMRKTASKARGGAIDSESREAGRSWLAKAPYPLSRWTEGRDIRSVSKRPFHKRWRKRRG